MENLNTEIKKKIIDFLKTTKYGASSSEISKSIGHNRVTVTKYLEIMRAHKLITYDDVAQAKLWRIVEKSGKPKLLIVDDEPYVVDLAALSLLPGNYEVVKSYSGLDALEKVKKESPDLMILDLMMPGMDGFEVCKKIKENPLTQHIPIIMLTAKTEASDKMKGIKAGAEDYITKPFDPVELESRVNLVLRRTNHNMDVHPLTRLPGKNSLREDIQKRMLREEDFTIYNFKVENMDTFGKKHGFKKCDDVLILLSRMLSEILPVSEGNLLGHTHRDHFIVISPKKDANEKIFKSFEKLLPYIYKSTPPKNHISLSFSKLTSAEIKKRSMPLSEVMVKMSIW
ncbi:MAG: response regulator [Candidatus Woesearchaeota archaeon]